MHIIVEEFASFDSGQTTAVQIQMENCSSYMTFLIGPYNDGRRVHKNMSEQNRSNNVGNGLFYSNHWLYLSLITIYRKCIGGQPL